MNQPPAPASAISTGSESLELRDPLLRTIRHYWNEHIHDLEVATQPVGSAGFFQELEAYRFDKLRYLPQLVDFCGYQEKKVLEVGCGIGIDLLRFARGGALATGIDLAEVPIDLARQNFACHGLSADLRVMNGEALEFPEASFDLVYAHGVLQYTAHPERMAGEICRVLRPGGTAILMVYNRRSWLNALSRVMKIELEHQDAPVLRKYSTGEFKQLLRPFSHYRIIPERFPVVTRLHHGWKALLYNRVFVKAFEILPKRLVRPLGWHLMAFASR
jgi:2-polyprenyl-3-methyl-5-hydroxy-6-metoxy-1,4-benzoquinol methylase